MFKRFAAAFTLCLATMGPVAFAGDGKVIHFSEHVTNSYIVVLNDCATCPTAEGFAKGLARTGNGKVQGAWNNLHSLSIQLPNEAAAEAISRHPAVKWVQQDAISHGEACNRPLIPNSQWSLDILDGLDNNVYTSCPGTGVGVTVYVIDDAINPFHPELGGRVVGPFDFSGQQGTAYTDHATGIASLIGGGTLGVMTLPQFQSYRVLYACATGTCATDTAINSAVSAIVNAHGAGVPAVANFSISNAQGNPVIDTNMDALVNDGIFVASIAGNQNIDACGTSPARHPNSGMIVSGATTRARARAGYSNYGNCVDMWAGGGDGSNTAGQDVYMAAYASGAYRLWNGTSFTAPLVAGVAVKLLDANPSKTPAQIKTDLLNYANQFWYLGGNNSWYLSKFLNSNVTTCGPGC